MSPHPTRYYGAGDLHFVTFSCYRRQPLLGNASRRDLFLRALEEVRRQYRFLVVGYVVMPEHVHLLVSEPERRNLSVVLKALKQAVARRALGELRQECQGRQGCPRQIGVPQTSRVCSSGRERPSGKRSSASPPDAALPRSFWQARFYDFNVWSAKKLGEKLRYMHRNPVTRGLVASPEEWRWSSFRSYAFGEKGLVAVNAMFPPKWALAGTAA